MDLVDFSSLIKEFQKASTKGTTDNSIELSVNTKELESSSPTYKTDNAKKNETSIVISYKFELNIEEKEFILTLNKYEKNIEFIINEIKGIGVYKTNKTFEDIKSTKCFSTDESLDEIFVIMNELINLRKIKLIKENENLIKLVFQDEIRRKIVTSTFELQKENLSLNGLLENIASKLCSLYQINKEKENEIEKMNKEINILVIQNDRLTKVNQELLNNYSNLKDALLNYNSQMDKLFEENKNNRSIMEMLLEQNQKNKIISDKLVEENKFLNMQIIKLNDENRNIIKSISKLPEYQNKSKIILNSEINLLKEWIGKEFIMELIYSSDIHPKNVRFFHDKCDNIRHTITVVESEYGRRFGGYTKLEWRSCELDEFSKGDGNDFIFSLTKKTMFRNNKNLDQAIWNYANYFPCFGGGCDLQLYYNCFDSNGATTNFQHSYGVGAVLDEDRRSYLAGNNSFKVYRLEIFRLHFD